MKIKNILLGFSLHIISLVLGIIFIYSITNTKNSTVPSEPYIAEETLDVSNLITDLNNENVEPLQSFIKNLYGERNKSIKSGNVENLYKYYDISTRFGANSLEQEFKRIAYFKDWTIDKNACLNNIKSYLSITSLKEKDGILNIIVNENFSFTFFFNKTNNKKHDFSHNIVHTLQVKPLDNKNFIVLSDCYDDFLKGELDRYKFNLTEKDLIPNIDPKTKLNLLIE